MVVGLHNVYSKIARDLRFMQAGDFGPETGRVGERRTDRAHSVAPISYQKAASRKEAYHRLCERFIYLAATPSNRIVKVGMSAWPERRVAGLLLVSRAFSRYSLSDPRGNRWLAVRLVRAWSLGSVSTCAAFECEQAIHKALRSVASQRYGEWYRLSTSKAQDTLERVLKTMSRRTVA